MNGLVSSDLIQVEKKVGVSKEMGKKKKIEWPGMIATIASISAFLPLLYHTTANNTTESLSYAWLVVTLFSEIFWIAYGVMNRLLSVFVSSLCFFLLYLYLTILKICHDLKKKDDDEKKKALHK